MAYSDFVADQEYPSKQSGSALHVLIIDEDDPTVTVIGATTGINATDDFEVIPIEEAGEDGVDEIVQGRHSGNLTVPAFWTAEWNDSLPTRQTFIGKSYTIVEQFGEDRPNAGVIINAFTGCKLSRVGSSNGARGAKTFDLAFAYERRYNGQEWATLTGA